MYADNISLIAASPSALQFMLNLVDQRWRYQLNGIKSVVLVFGEAAKTREREHALRNWKFDTLRSASNSTMSHTNERTTTARSTFFALNSVVSHVTL